MSARKAEMTREFFMTSSFHGFRHYYGSRNLLAKLFWITIVAMGFALVSYQIYRLIAQFCENPTVTDIKVIHPDDGLDLPQITVCTLTKINKTALNSLHPDVNLTLAEFMVSSFLSAYNTALMDPDYFVGQGLKEESLEEQLETLLQGNSLVELLENVTFQCDQLFLKCWYKNGPIRNCCDDQHFSFRRFLTHNGPCFYLTGNRLPQNLPGPVGGLGFIYRQPQKHVTPIVFGSYAVNAVYMFTDPAAAIIEKNPILLPIGSRAHVSLKATKTVKKLSAFADLMSERKCGRNQTLTLFDNYSFEKCQVECMVNYIMSECDCAGLNTYINFPVNKTCTPLQANHCYKRLAYNFSHILSSCRKVECLEACEYWSYSHSLTLGEVFYPGLEKDQALYWRLPSDCDEKSIIMTDIYFDDILYTEITQLSAFTFEALVSNIGGALGLWTGASIITLIHAIYFCCFLTIPKPGDNEEHEIVTAQNISYRKAVRKQNLETLL